MNISYSILALYRQDKDMENGANGIRTHDLMRAIYDFYS